MTTEADEQKKPEDQTQPAAAGAETVEQQPVVQTEAEKLWAEIPDDNRDVIARPTGEDVSDEITPAAAAVTESKVDAAKDASEGADKPTDVAAKSTDTPAAPTPKEDIWANASPELRAAHEAEVAAVRTKATNDAKAEAGRIRKQYEERQKASATRDADQPSSKKVGDILDEGLADYPEMAKPVKDAFAPIEKKLERFDRIEAANDAAEAERINGHIRSQQTILEAAHPGWHEELVKGPKGKQFYDWISSPDRPVKFAETVFKTNKEHIFDAPAAIEVFDAFKAFLAPPETSAPAKDGGQTQELSAKRAAQLDGTVSPRSPGGAPRVSGIPKEGDPKAIWAALPDDNADDRLAKGGYRSRRA